MKGMGGTRWGLAVLAVVLVGCGAHSGLNVPSTSHPPGAPAVIASTGPDEVSPEEAAARLDPASYVELAPRDFALLVKNPDARKGERYVVYGKVTQFDTATGTDQFRADTGAVAPENLKYPNYNVNTYLTVPDPPLVANVVQDDVLKMFVEVSGAYTYETTNNGKLTVPSFSVFIIDNLTQAG